MADTNDELDRLRSRIDAIDDELHATLMRRAELVQEVAAAKRRQASDDRPPAYLHPGREAQVLRRRLQQHHGDLPGAVVARIWRELIGAFGQMQRPLSVLVHAPTKSVGYWDLARNHFGSGADMMLLPSAQRVLAAIANDDSALGVLAMPEDDEASPWWPHLLAGGDKPLSVVARLPFYASESGAYENLSALVVAPFAPEDSGADISLIAVETSELSRASLLDALKAVGVSARIVAGKNLNGDAERLHLLEIDGFIAADDPRLAELTEDGEIDRLAPLGGYAVPIGQLA